MSIASPILPRRLSARIPALSAVFILAGGCASAGRLAEYDFRDRTLAVVNVAPPLPRIETGEDMEVDPADWVGTAARVGAGIFKEGMAEGARARLDSASRTVDAGSRMSSRLLELGSRELRARPVDASDGADFELEVRIREYGIEADDWDAQARFFLRARVRLLHSETGAEIWKADVDESEALNDQPRDASPGGALSSVITGGTLARLSSRDMEHTLAALADYAADRVTDRLRKGLDKARS